MVFSTSLSWLQPPPLSGDRIRHIRDGEGRRTAAGAAAAVQDGAAGAGCPRPPRAGEPVDRCGAGNTAPLAARIPHRARGAEADPAVLCPGLAVCYLRHGHRRRGSGHARSDVSATIRPLSRALSAVLACVSPAALACPRDAWGALRRARGPCTRALADSARLRCENTGCESASCLSRAWPTRGSNGAWN